MTAAAIADLFAFERREEHRAWYFYDWANSATSRRAVRSSAPYLTSVAEALAGGRWPSRS